MIKTTEEILIEKLEELLSVAKNLFNKENLQKFIIKKDELEALLKGFDQAIELAIDRLSAIKKAKRFFIFKNNIFGKDEEIIKILITEAEFLILHINNLKQDFLNSNNRFYSNAEGTFSFQSRDEQMASHIELHFIGDSSSDRFYLDRVVRDDRRKLSSAAEGLSIFFESLAQFDKIKTLFHTIKEFTDLIKTLTR